MRSPPPMDMKSLSVPAAGRCQGAPCSSSPRAEVKWEVQQGEGEQAWGGLGLLLLPPAPHLLLQLLPQHL